MASWEPVDIRELQIQNEYEYEYDYDLKTCRGKLVLVVPHLRFQILGTSTNGERT